MHEGSELVYLSVFLVLAFEEALSACLNLMHDLRTVHDLAPPSFSTGTDFPEFSFVLSLSFNLWGHITLGSLLAGFRNPSA